MRRRVRDAGAIGPPGRVPLRCAPRVAIGLDRAIVVWGVETVVDMMPSARSPLDRQLGPRRAAAVRPTTAAELGELHPARAL